MSAIPVLLLVLSVLAALLGMGLAAFFLVYNKPTFLVYFQLIYCSVMRIFIDMLHFPGVLRFLPDVVTLMLLIQCVFRAKKTPYIAVTKVPMRFVGGFLIVTLFAFWANAQPVLSLVWGVRVVLRAFVFWFACVLFLTEKDVFSLIRIFFLLLVANVLMASFQYFVQGYRNDSVGGLFGTVQGPNGPLNLLLLQMAICAMTMFVYYKCGWKLLALTLACTMFVAAISELKAVFFEIPMAFLILLLCSGWRRRTVSLLLAGATVAYAAIVFFLVLYPNWSDFFTLDSIHSYIADVGYGGAENLNRTTALPFVFEMMLTTPLHWLVGYGLGNADYAAFYTSELMQKYGETHYYYFGIATLLAESGVLGSILYLGFFGSVFFSCFLYRRQDPENACWYTITMISSSMILYHLIYNHALRGDIIYNYMFWMAIPFVIRRENFIRLENKGKMVGAKQLRERR